MSDAPRVLTREELDDVTNEAKTINNDDILATYDAQVREIIELRVTLREIKANTCDCGSDDIAAAALKKKGVA